MLLQQQKAKESHFIYISLLLVAAIAGYWQISFLKYSVTHDMINCWIPWRHYISDSIQNHVFPFWNPYQQLGYPIHADLQGPSWYIESLLLSMTIGQNNYVVQLLFVFYTFIAGVGMYFLSLCFHANKKVAFIVGASYMLSGFFVAHVQHFYAVIGAAWLPFIILNYYKMHKQKSYMHALYASLFMFFNLTGGNHTFSIILVYLFIFIFGFFVVRAIMEKNTKDVLQFIKLNALFALCAVVLATVVITAYFQTAPYIDRLSGLSYKNASIYHFSPQSLLSLVFPFSTVNGIDFYNTDPSMCNIYLGVVMLIFVAIALINKKTTFEKVLLLFGIICLFASFGPDTIFHKLIFDSLPLMDLFRNPSYFSLFTIIIFLLLGGNKLAELAGDFKSKRVVGVVAVIGSFILIALIFAFYRERGHPFFFLKSYDTIFDFINAASFYQNILLQGTIQLVFLSVFLFTILSRYKKHWLQITACLILLNLVISTQLNIALVGFSPASPKELKDYVETLPKGFPIPDSARIIDNKEELGQKHGLYRNTSLFHKRISGDVFNSYAFKSQVKLLDSFPVLYNAMLSNRLLYFSSAIHPESYTEMLDSNSVTNKTLVFSNADYLAIKKSIDTNSSNPSKEGIKIAGFSANGITAAVYSEKASVLTLLQSYYGGWEAFINDRKTEIRISNFLTMSILVPAGKHDVRFKYRNPAIVTAAIISYSAFFILLVIISIIWWRRKENRAAVVVIFGVLIFSCVYYFF